MIVDGRKKENLEKAVNLIRSGDVVAFPTETVYGLGADAFNIQAVEKIFEVKGRPFQDPLICHIGSHEQLALLTDDVPSKALRLMERFWPGPLTIVLKKSRQVSDLITAGLDTVAVRMPRNIIALALIKNSKSVIAAPSANKFQGLSPTTAQAVDEQLGKKIPLILDGGPSLVGLESTIVRITDEGAEVLRLGGISVENIEEVLDEKVKVVRQAKKDGEPLVAPGTLDFHYAPKKPTVYVSPEEFAEKFGNANLKKSAVVCFSQAAFQKLSAKGKIDHVFTLSPEGDFQEAARNYYETLRQIDNGHFEQIICVAVPDEDLGKAINDRFRKAQHR